MERKWERARKEVCDFSEEREKSAVLRNFNRMVIFLLFV